MTQYQTSPDESGAALLLALLALSLLSLLGLFISLSATTGVHISDNYESQLQATYAALAGLNHARALLRGLSLNDLLSGPDGKYNASAVYLAEARSFQFRTPLALPLAQALDITDPSLDVSGISDDGLFSTGAYNGTPGTALIPKTGISQVAPNPYAPGTFAMSRYFVKSSDNNGEASEIAGDVSDNPFVDGDGIIIVRSLGVARTISNTVGSAVKRNSVAVFEARFKRLSTWKLGAALVVLGSQVHADFDGAFEIAGGALPGIGTIDPVPEDEIFPVQTIRTALGGSGQISGEGAPNPSVRDITGQMNSNKDQLLLLDPDYLWDFVTVQAPRFADNYYDGNQNWTDGLAPYIGAYDPTKPANAPEQDPEITVVNGDLLIAGNLSGGGILIVTGDFSCSGSLAYNGLVLIIGSGHVAFEGSGTAVSGGVFAASVINAGSGTIFGIPGISIRGFSTISADRDILQMAVGLIPPSQISFREIAGSDP
jgi:hypothetical protein